MTSAADVALRAVSLASAVDFEGFRHACRQLWAEQVAPDHVSWHTADDVEGDLFDDSDDLVVPNVARPTAARSTEARPTEARPTDASATDASAIDASAMDADSTDSRSTGLRSTDLRSTDAPGNADGAPPVNAPASFMTLAGSVVLHSDPGRFGLLYRLLWRLQIEPGLRRDPLDADWVEAEHMAQAVRRDMHKMKAFVRFRPIEDGAGPGVPLHVAWFEPEHHIVEATAPFFTRRFTAMQWAILTPERSIHWDGRTLTLGPKARRDQAPPSDAGEQLWFTYYQSIFNPARLKLKMMQKEMPRRYWKNLPEAQLIDPLAAAAAQRSQTMIDRPPTEPKRRLPAAAPQPTPGHPVTPGGVAPSTLPALRDALERCRECPIGEHATQAVPGEGPQRARLMFVGEQPGDQEDLQGRPFVGPAGQLFARAMEELGLTRKDVYITNAVKHFKFELRGKRRIHKTPAQQEAAACLHWLESEIGLVEPDALIALGATAARQLMGRAVAVTRERGQWLTRSDGRRVLITLHPSALLRMEPEDKADAYRAWLDDLRRAADFRP